MSKRRKQSVLDIGALSDFHLSGAQIDASRREMENRLRYLWSLQDQMRERRTDYDSNRIAYFAGTSATHLAAFALLTEPARRIDEEVARLEAITGVTRSTPDTSNGLREVSDDE